jgi:hypothetical protein
MPGRDKKIYYPHILIGTPVPSGKNIASTPSPQLTFINVKSPIARASKDWKKPVNFFQGGRSMPKSVEWPHSMQDALILSNNCIPLYKNNLHD